MLAAFQICIFGPILSIFLVFQVFIPKFELRWDFDLVVNRSQPLLVQVLFLFKFSKRSSNTCLSQLIYIFREIKKKDEYLLHKFVWLKICPNWLESVLSCRMKRRIKELISKSDPSIVSRGYSTPGSPAIWGNNYSGLICKKYLSQVALNSCRHDLILKFDSVTLKVSFSESLTTGLNSGWWWSGGRSNYKILHRVPNTRLRSKEKA